MKLCVRKFRVKIWFRGRMERFLDSVHHNHVWDRFGLLVNFQLWQFPSFSITGSALPNVPICMNDIQNHHFYHFLFSIVFQSFILFFLLYTPQFFSPTHILAFNAISSGNIRTLGADLVTTIMFRDIWREFHRFPAAVSKALLWTKLRSKQKGETHFPPPGLSRIGFHLFSLNTRILIVKFNKLGWAEPN